MHNLKRNACTIQPERMHNDLRSACTFLAAYAKNSHSGRFSMILGVFLMYISSNSDQLTIEDFFMPFGGNLLKTNRWVRLASMMPWEHIEHTPL